MTEMKEPWHLDRKVPIVLILVIIGQTLGVVWQAASVNFRVMNQQMQIDRQAIAIERLQGNTQAQEVAAARLSQELADVQRALGRLESGQQQTNDYLRGLITDTGKK